MKENGSLCPQYDRSSAATGAIFCSSAQIYQTAPGPVRSQGPDRHTDGIFTAAGSTPPRPAHAAESLEGRQAARKRGKSVIPERNKERQGERGLPGQPGVPDRRMPDFGKGEPGIETPEPAGQLSGLTGDQPGCTDSQSARPAIEETAR